MGHSGRTRFRSLMPRTRPSATLVIAVLALLVSLGGNAAAALLITSNSQVAKNTISGHQPPSGDHANLIASSVNGSDVADDSLTGADVKEPTLKGVAHRLFFYAAPSGALGDPRYPPTVLATVGPWKIKARCGFDEAGYQVLRVLVLGPGEAQTGYDTSFSDQTFGEAAKGTALSPDLDTSVLEDRANAPFVREWGSVALRASRTIAMIDFHSVTDVRTGLKHCFLYGTATLGV